MHLTSDKRIWIPDDEDWIKWGGNYEQIEFDNIMNHHISNWDVALDVGAHVGIWSTRLAERFKKVIAFEPVPKHIECWKRNMLKFIDERSEWGNISTLETVALGHENGTATMKVPNTTNTGMASLVHKVSSNEGTRWVQPEWENFPELEVETRTLDSYEFDHIDFIKIDVEWFELKVLQGAENTIRKHKPIMYIEMSDPQAYTFMKELDMDYRIFYSHSMNRLWNIDYSQEWRQHIKKIDKLKKIMKSVKE